MNNQNQNSEETYTALISPDSSTSNPNMGFDLVTKEDAQSFAECLVQQDRPKMWIFLDEIAELSKPCIFDELIKENQI